MNREDFLMLNKDIVYFDNGATTLKPKVMIDATIDYYANYTANAHRGDYDISLKVDNNYENTRLLVKEFINADSTKEIVFTSGATDSLNRIVFGYFQNTLKENDEVIITKSEHASNVLPWFELAKRNKIKIKYIELTSDYKVTIDNLKKVITSNTKVISLAHVTNVIGDVRPIKEISALAHENNILLVVDGAQSVPHIPVDVKEMDIDFLAFSAHKMCGPTGVGVLYGKYELLDKLKPTVVGGGMNSTFSSDLESEYNSLPHRLEAGTPNIAGVIAFGKVISYLNNIGMDKINKYEKDLRRYLINELNKLDFVEVYNKDVDTNIVAFNIKGVFAQDAAIYLDKYNICVRAGNHCAKILDNVFNISNTVRISLSFYNNKEEIDLLINVLKNRSNIWKEIL